MNAQRGNSGPPSTPGARWALALVTLLVCALILEVGLRFLTPAERPFSSRGNLPWIAWDADLGWVNRAGFQGRHTKPGVFDVAIEINAEGFRMRKIDRARTAGQRRVLVLGDSFTFGHGVEAADTFCARLERQLDRTEVLNTAVMGVGHDQQLLWLRERGLSYKPDLVIWGFSSADIPRNTIRFWREADPDTGLDFAKPRFVLRDGRLELTGVPTPSPETIDAAVREAHARAQAAWPTWLRIVRRSALARTVDNGLANLRRRREQLRLTRAIARELIHTCRDAGVPLLVVNLPVENWLARRDILTALKRRTANGLIHDVCHTEQADLLDLYEAFRQRSGGEIHSLFIPTDGHYSPAGHDCVASELLAPVQARLPSLD